LPSSPSLSSEDAGASLDEEPSDTTDEEDTGADSEEVATVFEELDCFPEESASLELCASFSTDDEGVFDSEEICVELDESTSAELDRSALSLEGVSTALADEESSPQATMPAPTRAQKQKAKAWSLMQYNIPKNEMQNLSILCYINIH
jgi:hypothetical protein